MKLQTSVSGPEFTKTQESQPVTFAVFAHENKDHIYPYLRGRPT